ETDRVETGVSQELPRRSMKLICPAAERSVDNRAATATEFSAIGIGFNFEFGDRIWRRLNNLIRKTLVAAAKIIVVEAINYEIGECAAQTVDVKRRFATGASHNAVESGFPNTRSQQCQICIRPAVERQTDYLSGIDNLTAFAGIGLEQLRRAADHDVFG